MKIERWFKGQATCDGQRPDWAEPVDMERPVFVSHCLWTRIDHDVASGPHAVERMAAVVSRLFGDRCTCRMGEWSPLVRIIHANNNPATTREDIDKILRVFTEEMEEK